MTTPSSPFEDPNLRVSLRRDALAWRRVADDVVLLDTERSRYHAVNATGGVLWELLDEGATVADLTATLVHAYPESAARAAGDVRAFLDGLHERGLLELPSADGPAGAPK